MPDPVTARKAVGTAVPVISTAAAVASAPAPAASLAEQFPPTVLPVDEFTGQGGTYSMDPETGVRVRIDEIDVVTVTGEGTGAGLDFTRVPPVVPDAVVPAADGTTPTA